MMCVFPRLGGSMCSGVGAINTAWAGSKGGSSALYLHQLTLASLAPPAPACLQELVQRYAILPQYDEMARDRESGAVHVRLSAAGVSLGESFEATNFRNACRLAARNAVERCRWWPWPSVLGVGGLGACGFASTCAWAAPSELQWMG